MLTHVNHADHSILADKLVEIFHDRQAGKISPQEWAAALRYAAEKCLSVFLYYVLGYMDIDNDFHDKFIGRVEEQRDHDLFLLPRFHLKTSIFIDAEMLWTAAKTPTIAQGLGSDTLGRASNFLRGIRLICETRKELPALWPHIFFTDPQKQSGKWTETELLFKILPEGADGIAAKEASITAFGFEVLPTGSHFAKINGDDLVNEKNTNTKDLIDKVRDNFGLARGICPLGPIRLSGTIYAFGDLHTQFQQQENWRVLCEPAHDEGYTNIRFPVKFNEERFKSLRKDMGPYLYSCQFLLDPIDPEHQMFPRRWFQYFDQWKPGPYRSYITIDLAYSDKKAADFTTIVHSKTDQSKNLYVSDYIKAHLSLADMIHALFDMIQPINTLDCVGVEIQPSETEQNSAVCMMIREEMRRRGKFFMLKGIKPVRDKVARANALVPLFANGMVFMRRSMTELEDELLRFPKGEHDDLVDALAYVPHIWHQAVIQKVPQPVVGDALIGY